MFVWQLKDESTMTSEEAVRLIQVRCVCVCNRYSMRPSVLCNIQAQARGRVVFSIKHEDFSCYMCLYHDDPLPTV